jgi:hypothetical protein
MTAIKEFWERAAPLFVISARSPPPPPPVAGAAAGGPPVVGDGVEATMAAHDLHQSAPSSKISFYFTLLFVGTEKPINFTTSTEIVMEVVSQRWYI